jgi:adenosylmethionine-8-amino-7-oxononanoate aminotransferase
VARRLMRLTSTAIAALAACGASGSMFASPSAAPAATTTSPPAVPSAACHRYAGDGAIGAMIASEKVIEPFLHPGLAFPPARHTFGCHPVAAALSLANLDIIENERLNQRVLDNEAALGATLGELLDLPMVGDVRGDSYFWAVELVKDKGTR